MVDVVRTESDLLTNLFQDGQADYSITAQDIRDLIVSIKYLNGDAWEFHFDNEYTLGSPKTILAGVRTKVTIDGLLEDTGHPITGHSSEHFWNPVTNKIEPPNLNDFGIGRFAVTSESVLDPDNSFDIEVEVIGGDYPIIYRDTAVFAKGAGVIQHFNFIVPLFVGPDFLTYGATLFITPQSDALFWEHALTITRTYLARP